MTTVVGPVSSSRRSPILQGLYLAPPQNAIVLVSTKDPRSSHWTAPPRCCRCSPGSPEADHKRPRRHDPVRCGRDRGAVHKTTEIRDWLARNPRIYAHFTPTSALRMNLVEVWIGIIERQAGQR
jgi:hypothetical protein